MDPRDTMFSMCTVWPIPREVIPRIKLASMLSSITFETNVHLYRVDHEDGKRVCTSLKADKLRSVVDYIYTQTDNYFNWTVDRVFYDFPWKCIGIEIVPTPDPEPMVTMVGPLKVPKRRPRRNIPAQTISINYLAILRDLYKDDHFRIAHTIDEYDSDKYDGLLYYDCVCLRGEVLRKLEKSYPDFNFDNCIQYLLSQNALKLVDSKYTVQIYKIGGKRFYAIYLEKLQ